MMKILQFLFMLLLYFNGVGSARAQRNIVVLDDAHIKCEAGLDLSSISFRGLDVVNNLVVWASGSKGVFARSIDGGKTFEVKQIPGYDSSDFRGIRAFNANQAIVMSSGSPSYILKTFDGGKTWKKVFEDRRKELFLDAIDFWDEDKGMVIGDPIDERFILYRTTDGGNTWYAMDTSMRPWAVAGESLFAASGTSFRCMPKNSIAFVTGGYVAALHWLQIDKKYRRFELKSMNQGKPSDGAFSFDFTKQYIVMVGGDYASDTAKAKHGLYRYGYDKFGLQLMNMKPFYSNYRSCVAIMENGDFITCGTKGVDFNNALTLITTSNEKSQISDQSFHVVRKARKGSLIIMAGSRGKLARIEF
ncbi:MAG: YCF48-related protein [bacterium]|nr:YCF48-related protein [bacterium]